MKSVSFLKPWLLETKFASSFSLLPHKVINLGAATPTIDLSFNMLKEKKQSIE